MTLWLAVMACGAPTPAPPSPDGTDPVGTVTPIDRDGLAALLTAPGRPRVVNFWATWCGPCKDELPHLKAFAASHAAQADVVMVSLDLMRLQPRVQEAVEQAGLAHVRHVQLDDPDPLMALPALVPSWPDAVPVTLVVSPEGRTVHQIPRALRPGELEAWFESQPGWWNR